MDEPLTFADIAAWESWLDEHHATADGAWLRVRKKNARVPAITAPEAGDAAMCFGWIDSHRRGLDADYFLQRYSRRSPKGTWSQVNVARAGELIAAGRMRPAGYAEIEAARADGRWQAAYAAQSTAEVPADVTAALATDPEAAAAFAKLGKTERYLLVLPVLKAVAPKTRAARVRKLLDSLRTGG
ncbi:YdeI/OmpD-associated family protein [Hamadaea tsunoensis]|uniref:YdeI/OmpD-associated family protein n=1 Tax=Hamadaea tsunoensis TaxID=53368 RepID=UPI00041DC817|nr:YdeI/OmpD-associated family protein [Hamadaea tsunoensis]